MQIPKKLKAILIIVFFTLVIIMPVFVALVREYSYKDNQVKKEQKAQNSADAKTDKSGGK